MKLTEEQREAIMADLNDITLISNVTLWKQRCRTLLSSEQAWKEEAETQRRYAKNGEYWQNRYDTTADKLVVAVEHLNQAVEVLKEVKVIIDTVPKGGSYDGWIEEYGETAPLAICRAALLAVME